VEAAGPNAYDFSSFSVATHKRLAELYQRSPVAYVDRVKTPTLTLLGKQDRRVPFSQGVEYHHALQSRNIPSKMMIFPEDVHAIDKPMSEAEQWISIADWIAKYNV